jgi:DNA invertase Pin-like site-specific DNA recombinase
MRIGYARVSTLEQNLDLQEDALKASGCEKIYSDHTGGTKAERPGLERALADVRLGDSLVVWKLDRLGRSLKHLIETVTDLSNRGVGFQSLQEAIDTTTSGGKLIFHVFGALAEFERDIIPERTLAPIDWSWFRLVMKTSPRAARGQSLRWRPCPGRRTGSGGRSRGSCHHIGAA